MSALYSFACFSFKTPPGETAQLVHVSYLWNWRQPGEHRLTLACLASTLKAMEVHLPPNQVAQLNELAVKSGRGTDDLVQEAVAKLLSHNEWFKQQVQIGIDQIARGEFIEEEEMDARIERMLQS